MTWCARDCAGVESGLVVKGKDRTTILTEISLILTAVFWGLNFAATKYAAESIPPLVLVAFRFTGGGLLLLLILRLLEPESRPRRKDLLLMASLDCFGVAIAQSGFDEKETLTTLFKPYPAEAMEAYPVSRKVNKPSNNGPSCIESVA